MVALIGVAVGLWIGQMTAGALESAVAGLLGRDLGLLLSPSLALLAATLAGALGPAWRAARAAPATIIAALEDAGI